MTVKNSDKSRTFISKVCGYYPRFESKVTQWGITNEPITRKNYTTKNKSKHKNFKVKEPGLFIDMENQFIGASPDGLIECTCHEPGVLEIKCPWSCRVCRIKTIIFRNK